MNAQHNQLGQYTVPTTPKEQAFYSRHSGAIKRYTIAIVLIQLAWSFFSYNPAMALLMENTTMLPAIQPYLPLLVGGILATLHFVLKSETLETFSNVMDKDETTINGWWNYLIPILVCIGLFILDLKGVSTTFRDKSFDGKKKEVSAESQKALDKAKADYATALIAIASTRKDDSTAAVAPFTAQFAAAERMVHNDAQDRAAKARKVNSIRAERSAALSVVLKESSEAQKQALALYSAEKLRITGKLDSAHATLDGQDSENAIKADNYSWVVSAFFLVLFLLMNYKLVYLRVNSGIKVNVEFTQLDAEGSFLEKLQRVVLSILQRQGHRFLVFCHKMGSKGTATLSTFDGRVILQPSSYNGSTEAKHGSLPNNPNPTPLTFSKSPTAPAVLVAKSTPIGFNRTEDGNVKSALMDLKTTDEQFKVSLTPSKRYSECTHEEQNPILFSSYDPKSAYLYEEWVLAVEQVNPYVFRTYNTMSLDPLDKIKELATSFAQKRLNPTPSVKSETKGGLSEGIPMPLPAFTLSDSAEDPTPAEAIEHFGLKTVTTVSQPESTVTQSEAIKTPSQLDDKLENLRKKILENSESHFKRGDSKNGTVAKRIFGHCDAAFLAIKKGGEVRQTVLIRFQEAALDRLDLCAAYDYVYDSRNDLMSLIEKRKEGING